MEGSRILRVDEWLLARSARRTDYNRLLITPLHLLPFPWKILIICKEKLWSLPSTNGAIIWGSKGWTRVLWALKGAPGPNYKRFSSVIFVFGFMLLSFHAQATSSLLNLRVIDRVPGHRLLVTAAGHYISRMQFSCSLFIHGKHCYIWACPRGDRARGR